MQNISRKKNLIIFYSISQVLLITLALFLLISVCLNASYISIIDNFMFSVFGKIRSKAINNIFLFITYLGETETIILILILALFFKNRKNLLPLYYLTIISVFLNYCIKNFVCRFRPSGQFVTNLIINYPFPSSYSFPSGHSQTSLVVYFILTYLLLKNYNGTHRKLYLSLSIVLPVLIMISRIVLGVHFFSDVLMGATLGAIIISNFVFFDKLNMLNNPKIQKYVI